MPAVEVMPSRAREALRAAFAAIAATRTMLKCYHPGRFRLAFAAEFQIVGRTMKVLPNCDWFVACAQGHHGYPQPQSEDWEALVYEGRCLRCGVHGPQKSGFRLHRSNRASHSHFRQINWVFDAWFVRSDVEAALRSAKLSGLAFRDVIDHRSGNPFEEIRQLVIGTSIDGADTTKLPPVTCKPDNEEGPALPGPKKYPPAEPYCGAIKHHPPTDLVVAAASLSRAPDVVYTAAWFGSGGAAFPLTLVSRRFAEFVNKHEWRGLEFSGVSHDGYSKRRPTEIASDEGRLADS